MAAAAHRVARHIGVPVVEVHTNEGDRSGYRRNGPDRCFHCKDELFTRIAEEVLVAQRVQAVAYGENATTPGAPEREASGYRCRDLQRFVSADPPGPESVTIVAESTRPTARRVGGRQGAGRRPALPMRRSSCRDRAGRR